MNRNGRHYGLALSLLGSTLVTATIFLLSKGTGRVGLGLVFLTGAGVLFYAMKILASADASNSVPVLPIPGSFLTSAAGLYLVGIISEVLAVNLYSHPVAQAAGLLGGAIILIAGTVIGSLWYGSSREQRV